jgi:DNA polymerase (family 10)
MVAIRFAPPESFGSLWQWWTGSAAHNDALADRARAAGLDHGPFGIGAFAGEESLYQALGLPWIPPELREDRGEIAAAENRLPRLVTVADLCGDLHVHTDWSDGVESLDQMVAGAAARGYEYLAITDHSGGRAVARGLTVARLTDQIDRIRRYNAEHPDGPLVLVGSEVDIRADGTLDYPDEALAQLDVVVASIHSAMDQPREVMTARILKAIRRPAVTMLGHLTGRLIGRRDPIDVDVDAVLRACAEHGVWLEINANPARLDLKDEHVRLAKQAGVPVAIDTDAHAAEHFDFAIYGVGVARRAWLGPEDVITTLPRSSFLDRLRSRR